MKAQRRHNLLSIGKRFDLLWFWLVFDLIYSLDENEEKNYLINLLLLAIVIIITFFSSFLRLKSQITTTVKKRNTQVMEENFTRPTNF